MSHLQQHSLGIHVAAAAVGHNCCSILYYSNIEDYRKFYRVFTEVYYSIVYYRIVW